MKVFYRATARAYLDPSEWPAVAGPVKAGLRASLFQNLMVDAIAAISEETYDSLEGAHMSWSPLIVDEQGWNELTAILLRAMEEALEVHENSAGRLIARDAKGVSCTVSILGYPSANEDRKVGPPVDAKHLVDLTKPRQAKAKKAAKRTAKTAGKGRGSKPTPKPKRKDAGK